MQKPNPGWFKKGYDPRRHVLSRAERHKGFLLATQYYPMPSLVRAWLRGKVRGYYQEQKRRASA
jgi:hypothetical protein